MRWVFDVDGVITANPDFFRWWIYQLRKNGHKVFILTARNPNRRGETVNELKFWGIAYEDLYFMQDGMSRDLATQASWKLSKIAEIHPDVWVDDNFKIYKQVLGAEMAVPGVINLEI